MKIIIQMFHYHVMFSQSMMRRRADCGVLLFWFCIDPVNTKFIPASLCRYYHWNRWSCCQSQPRSHYIWHPHSRHIDDGTCSGVLISRNRWDRIIMFSLIDETKQEEKWKNNKRSTILYKNRISIKNHYLFLVIFYGDAKYIA